MRHAFLATVILAVVMPPVVRAEVTDAEIEKGIERIKGILYKSQNQAGLWDDPKAPDLGGEGRNWGGATALITYALLTAGESYQSPKLNRAVRFLADDVKMVGLYAVACRAHVWSHLPDMFNGKLREDLYWLQQAAHPVSTGGISFRYLQDSKDWDNSTAQYGVLGMWECAKRNLPVGQNFWAGFEKHAIASQNDDGGWSYTQGDSRTSMTTAGLVMLYITQDYLHRQDFRTVGRASKHPLQAVIDKGLGWLDKNYKPGVNVNGGAEQYTMYGIERVGIASGRKYLGGKDWYRTGAEWLLKNHGSGTNAAFSLLFLVRGRVPVFINKLEIPGYDWDNRPYDVARLTEWVSDEVEKSMNWQVIPITVAPEQWLDSPILYLASHEPLKLTEEQELRIKRYIDLGGMLITSADDSSTAFTQSVTDLLRKLYPKYKQEIIRPDDELMNVVFRMESNRLGAVSIHNGIRHLAVHLPRDVSWTLHSTNHTDPMPWQLFTNAYYYATEKGRLRNRLDQHYLAREKDKGGPDVTVARASYDGNWDPEPLAWEIQSNYMYNASKANVKVMTAELAKLPDPSEAPFVHVAGTTKVDFSDAQQEAVKHYVNAGGVIFFENAGGGGNFAESVIQMLGKAFPDQRVRPISTAAPLVTGQSIKGFDISNIDYRSYALLRMGQVDTPRLLTLNINDKPRVVISGEDLSEAMLDQPVWGVFGYDSPSAHKIMSNLVLYAMYGNKPAAPVQPVGAQPAAEAKPAEAKPAPAKPAEAKPQPAAK